MGAYKSLNYRWKVLGWRPSKGEALYYGVGPRGGELPTAEERAAESEAKREARAEREAIQAVEREEARRIRDELADEARRAQAAKPRTFAPPPPDFARTGRVAPISAGERMAHESGTSSPWPAAAKLYRGGRRAQAAVRDGLIPPGHQQLRDRLGPPEPPGGSTGWYACGDSWCRVGQWPYPEYRPPGLAWRLHWTDPKPDDVPWEDEVIPPAPEVMPSRPEIIPPRVDAAEPTPPRPAGGKLKQGSLF